RKKAQKTSAPECRTTRTSSSSFRPLLQTSPGKPQAGTRYSLVIPQTCGLRPPLARPSEPLAKHLVRKQVLPPSNRTQPCAVDQLVVVPRGRTLAPVDHHLVSRIHITHVPKKKPAPIPGRRLIVEYSEGNRTTSPEEGSIRS